MNQSTYYQKLKERNDQLKTERASGKQQCYFNTIGLWVPAIGIIVGIIIQFM